MTTEPLDGELYLFDNPPPDIAEFTDLGDEDPLEFELFGDDPDAPELKSATRNVVFERSLFRVKDPTSPPHTRNRCSRWARPWPGSRICVGWTLQYRWLYRVGSVKVTTISETEAKAALEDCLKVGAIAAAIAAIVSGGSAAVAAAEVALKACLVQKLGDKLISVSIRVRSTRGGWE